VNYILKFYQIFISKFEKNTAKAFRNSRFIMKKQNYTIILFYKFTPVKNPEQFKDKQRKIAEAFGLKGRMLIAKEGINATFEGEAQQIKKYIKKLREQKVFKDVVFKDSMGFGKAFTKLQVKVRPEVVTLGIGKLNIKKARKTGQR